MRAVIQKVKSASVSVDGEVVSSINRGLLCLLGIAQSDSQSELDYVCKKLLALRLFEDETGQHWKKSVTDIDGEVLCVSQFTLLAATRKGSKPDFHAAMGAEQSRQAYEGCLDQLGKLYRPDRIKGECSSYGRFGAMMDVQLTNEGPVTIIVDSHETRTTTQAAEPTATNEKAEAKAQRRAEAEARTAKNKEAKKES